MARFQGVQKRKKQPDGKQRAKVEREATGLKRKEKMSVSFHSI